MILLFDFIFCLVFITLQTAGFPIFFSSFHVFDISIPLILFFSLKRSLGQGIFWVIFLGVITDSFSSGPFGIYETVYLWFFICSIWIIRFFNTYSYFLISLIICSGILMENILLGIICFFLRGEFFFLIPGFNNFLLQVLCAAIAGPIMFYGIDSIQVKYESGLKIIAEKWKESWI